MQEEVRTEQRGGLGLLPLGLERVSYPSARAAHGSQPLGAMGLGSLGVRPGVTTPLGSGSAVHSVPPVVELERRLNERMDMWSTTAQASLHEDVPRGSETPTGLDEPRALEALAAKARKQDGPGGPGGPMPLDKAMITKSSAVAKLATALNEGKGATVLKWGRKKPTVKMPNPGSSSTSSRTWRTPTPRPERNPTDVDGQSSSQLWRVEPKRRSRWSSNAEDSTHTPSASSTTCRIQNPDTPRAGRFGAAHGRAAGRSGAG